MNIMQQPYFLNNGGNRKAKDGIMLWYAGKNPYIAGVTCTGAITIHSTYNGIATTETYTDLNNAAIAIKADPNTEVYIEGEVTSMSNYSSEKRIRCYNTALTTLNCSSCPGLTDLNLSANTALTTLNCYSCPGLTNLNLSANTALTSLNCNSFPGLTNLNLSANTALTTLYCYYCPGLTNLNLSANTALTSLSCEYCYYVNTIYAIARNNGVAKKIESAIQSAFATNGTLYINSSDTYASTVISAATAKGWTVENLPAA